MKWDQREKWLNLAVIEVHYPESGLGPPSINSQSLCHFCKYAIWGPCCDPDLECTHKLDVVNERCMDVWADCSDCWGFRPDILWDDAVEYTSERMQGLSPIYPFKGWQNQRLGDG